MYRFGLVAERFLCEPLRLAAGPGAFGPSVAVAVERDAGYLQPAATATELRGAVSFPHRLEFREERAGLRKGDEDAFKFCAEANNGGGPRFAAGEAHRLGLPVDVLSGEIRDVGLGAAEVPAKFVKGSALWVGFSTDDDLVLQCGDRPLFFEPNFGPPLFWKDRRRQPIHV